MGASESKSFGSKYSYGSWGAEEDTVSVEPMSPNSYSSWRAEEDAVSVESLGSPYSYGCWETDEDAHSEEPRKKIQEEDGDDTLMIAAVIVVAIVGWGICSLFFSSSPSLSSDEENKLMKAPESDPSAHFKNLHNKHF